MESYDVIVIGTGGAGLRAGIAAQSAGAKVLLMSKGPVKQSGCTVSAIFSYCAALGHADPNDTPEVHQRDILKSGEFINDPRKVRILAENAPQSIYELQSYGARFEKEGERFKQAWLPGHSFPRACYYKRITGKEIIRALAAKVSSLGIKVLEYTYAIDLLVKEKQVYGVLYYDLINGKIDVCFAPAVILATGGGGQVYSLNTNPREITGDGYAIALRSGCELVDMEFVQMYPTVIVNPIGAKGVEIPTGRIIPEGARLKDCDGNDFFKRYIPDGDIRTATRDTLARAIAWAIRDGKATANGGIYLDATMLAESKEIDQHSRYLLDLGVDVYRNPVEVAPGAHFFMGGILTSSDCSTNVKGLYACGEVAGGVHGANRLAGNALPETQVFGAIAGETAAKYALPVKIDRDTRAVDQVDRWTSWFQSKQKGSVLPAEIKRQVQSVMYTKVGVLRTEDELVEGIGALKDLERKWESQIWLPNQDMRFNWGFADALEARNMITVAMLITRAALERRETRGAHNRIDYPDKSEKFDGNVVLYMDHENLKTEFRRMY